MKILTSMVVGLFVGTIVGIWMLENKISDLGTRTRVLEARFKKIDEDEEAMKEVRRLAYIELGKSVISSSHVMIDYYDQLCKRVERDKELEPQRQQAYDDFYNKYKALEKKEKQ